ncbi:glycosyltransferase [Roseomonas sp. BN140053]|uniref:glycosyltransferase n=1 Tax=Roseomonas sp. BN140053 TaxID=3391898 RepID=UPI0039E92B9D
MMSGDEGPRIDALRAEADARRDAGDWRAAAAAYGRVVALRPGDRPALFQMGRCLHEAGEPAEALDALRAAEALAPTDGEVKLLIARCLEKLGRAEEAAAAFAAARALGVRIAPTLTAPPRRAPGRLLPALRSGSGLFSALAPETRPAPPPAGPTAPEPPRMPPAPRPAAPSLLASTVAAPPAAAPPALPAGSGDATPAAAQRLALAFDVTDLIDYFHGRRTPTGIQRVQAGIVGAALRVPAPPDTTLGCVCFDHRDGYWRALPAAPLLDLLAVAAIGADMTDPDWTAALARVDEVLFKAPRHVFPMGGLLVNLGNSWGLPDYFRGLRAAQRERGLRYIPFLHDCVPLIVPEHCQAEMVRDYARWFAAVGAHAHGFLCNSESTRRDGQAQLAKLLPGLDLPFGVVRLDADPLDGAPPPDPAVLDGLRGFRPGQPYALFVGTIESRKDHLLVFRAWLALIRKLGAARVPRLVCVGQPGWHAQGAMELLQNSAELKRHVVLLHGVSDEALAALYAGCRFTVYNSFYEGWGLPVTESLAHGKVPVVPEHSALPEAGGPGAVYFAPQHEPDLIAQLERLITDPAFLAEREEAVRNGSGLRRWSQLKDEALGHLRAMAARPAPPLEERLSLEPGELYDTVLGDETVPTPALAVRQVLRDGPNWYVPEDWGVWTRGGTATLRLPLPAEAAGEWRLYLDLRAPPGGGEVYLRAEPRGGEAVSGSVAIPGGVQGGCVLRVSVPQGCRLLEAAVDSTPFQPEGEERLLGVGLHRVMLCRDDDLGARLGWIEDRRLLPVVA